MKLIKLNRSEYEGKKFTITYITNGYYDIQRTKDGVTFLYTSYASPMKRTYEDQFYGAWLEDPCAYGIFAKDTLLGYVEGSLESWNNRYRISNICIFDQTNRHQGIGAMLMKQILEVANHSGARMVILETQTCNETAIAFYQKQGFSLIGFDLYAYSNQDPQNHEVRIEMGKML